MESIRGESFFEKNSLPRMLKISLNTRVPKLKRWTPESAAKLKRWTPENAQSQKTSKISLIDSKIMLQKYYFKFFAKIRFLLIELNFISIFISIKSGGF